MTITNSKQRKFGVVLQYLQMGISFLIQLIYTPIMLKILGDNEYGIYNVSNSIISYLSLLSLGFGASYIRFYSIYKKNNDDDGIKSLNGMYLLVFIIIGLIALTLGLILSDNVTLFYNGTYSDKELRTILGSFLFYGDDVFKKIEVLSPGEKARVALCKIMLERANLLLLDEPTNHLDPDTQKVIGENFKNYEGTIIMVSHNIPFIESINVDRILLLPSGKIINYDKERLEKYIHNTNNN